MDSVSVNTGGPAKTEATALVPCDGCACNSIHVGLLSVRQSSDLCVEKPPLDSLARHFEMVT